MRKFLFNLILGRRFDCVNSADSALRFEIFFELSDESPASSISPRRADPLNECVLGCGFEVDAGRAAASPRAFDGNEDFGIRLGKVMLLLGRELHHSPAVGRVAERSENPSVNAKIRMIHVRALEGFGQG